MMQGRKQSQHSVSRFEFADEGGFCFVAVKVGDLEEGTAAINFRAEDISLGWEGSVANIQFSWDLGGDQNTNGTAHIKFVPLELLRVYYTYMYPRPGTLPMSARRGEGAKAISK
uniref:Uncharacterized protein n=1 Tax=Oryza glumipatula TaxID=40148 RepID=A0A0D9ZR11_9ORYZ